MTADRAEAAHARRVDRVAAAGAVLALAAATLLPVAVFRANRIVAGTPHGVWSAGPAGYALVAACVAALAFAVWPSLRSRAAALAASAAAMSIGLAWALGQAAVLLRAGQSDISRVSIGSGAWLIGTGTAVVWFAALRGSSSRVARLVAGSAAVAGVVAAALVGGMGQLSIVTEYQNNAGTFWSAVGTHLALSGTALAIAIVLGVPLGVASARVPWLRSVALGVVGVIQTVPSLALLGLLVLPLAAVGLPGIGPLPAIIALTLYALLPIVRSTYIGLAGVDEGVVDAGRGMGMSGGQLLLRVEAPLALPLVIEGVRAAAVLVIGIATVVAFVGVGTLGVLVFEGWGQIADDLILLGAVPIVAIAVAVDAGLRVLQRVAVSPGIRREQA
jgi:osmoprotectant transport system permease protein